MIYNYSLNYTSFSENEISLPINNRGLMYGDGFFETMTLINKEIRFWDLHWERIQQALSIFEFQNESIKKDLLLREIKKISDENNLHNSIVKIIFWRTEGGLFVPNSHNVNFLIQQKNLQQNTNNVIKIGISKNTTNHYSLLSELKTISAAKYILVGLEIKNSLYNDLVILNAEGFVSELSSSNLFFIKDNKLMTPTITTGCVNGVMRKAILSSFNVEEKNISINDFKNCEGAFSSNASGIKIIESIEGKKFDTSHPVILNVTNWLKQQLLL